jgi:hypothetical protein
LSNIWRDIIPFVPIAQRWVPGRYSGALLNVTDCLQYLAWVYSTTRFENLPARVFYDLRLIDEETVKRGREQGVKAGWIGCGSGMRGTYTYWFLVNGRPLADLISQLPPSAGGQPKIKLREKWVYQADVWTKHLAKVNGRPSAKCRRLDPSELRQKRNKSESTSGKNQFGQRQIADSQSGQHIEKALLAASAPPLKKPLMNKDSEGVGVASVSEASEEKAQPTDECISPSWDALSAFGEQKKESERKGTKEQGQGKRSSTELLEDVAQDPIVQLLATKLNSKIVDVIDLRERGALEKVPGTKFEKWVQQKVFGR